MDDVENIERATLKAVKPAQLQALPGWLIPLDSGNVTRACSAVPLQHRQINEQQIKPIEQIYGTASLAAKFRLPLTDASKPFIARLELQGYVKNQPTLVQSANVEHVLKIATELASRSPSEVNRYVVRMDKEPDPSWNRLFVEPGKDEAYARSRVQVMQRAESGQFFSAWQNEMIAACGMAAFDNGWVSLHGMRTNFEHRRRGLATEIIRRMMMHAQSVGIRQTFLQVEAENLGAQAVYQQLGFHTVWTYAYWAKTAPAKVASFVRP